MSASTFTIQVTIRKVGQWPDTFNTLFPITEHVDLNRLASEYAEMLKPGDSVMLEDHSTGDMVDYTLRSR